MVISIIGLGLIGGSMGLALKKAGFSNVILGFDKDEENAQYALSTGQVDYIVSYQRAIEAADIIILAVPVNIILKLLPSVLDKAENKVVIDLGSTKQKMCELVVSHPNRENYVAAHPMAGTEFKGPQAARDDLYDDRHCIICNRDESNPAALKKATTLFEAIKLKIVFLESDQHDYYLAYLSHLSHISSFALSNSIFNENMPKEKVHELAGGGLYSTIRLANSNADMWIPIFRQNKENLKTAIDGLIENLELMKKLILKEDTNQMISEIKNANTIYENINSKFLKVINHGN